MLKQLSTKEEAKIRGLKNGQKVICKAEGMASLGGQIFLTENKFEVCFPGGSFIDLSGAVFTVEKREGDFGTVLTF